MILLFLFDIFSRRTTFKFKFCTYNQRINGLIGSFHLHRVWFSKSATNTLLLCTVFEAFKWKMLRHLAIWPAVQVLKCPKIDFLHSPRRPRKFAGKDKADKVMANSHVFIIVHYIMYTAAGSLKFYVTKIGRILCIHTI